MTISQREAIKTHMAGLQKATPSAPDWFWLIDHAVRELLYQRLETLEGGSGHAEEQDRSKKIASEAAFLVERLEELNWTGDGWEELYRDWQGHVAPSLARLKGLLFE